MVFPVPPPWRPPIYDGKTRFDAWLMLLEMYISECGLSEDKDKAVALLQHVGYEMFEKIYDWAPDHKPQDMAYNDLVELLSSNFTVMPNLFLRRMKFFTEKQTSDQSVQEYLDHMKQLYWQCAIKDMTPEEVGIILIILGLKNDRTRLFLLENNDKLKSIADVQRLALDFEFSCDAADALKNSNYQSKSFNKHVVGKGVKCKFCGESHLKGQCPAYGKSCTKCGKKNHAAKVCKSSKER